MGRSMRRASDLTLPGPANLEQPLSHRRFRVFREGKDLWQGEYGLDAAGNRVFDDTHKLAFAIGSGLNGYSFVVRRGLYLFEAPLSYYVKAAKWDFSPGYQSGDFGFSRPIAAACASCHAGRARSVADHDGLYGDPPFAELAIGCENCHGPGALHIVQMNHGSIVNPAKLPARLAEEICMICHQGGDARILQPGKNVSDFRPGMWSSDVLAIFVLSSVEGDLLNHHTGMKSSRCFVASGGRLTCLSCHDPHATPARADVATYYRAKCLVCHTDRSCRLPLAVRTQRAANDCIACHMPKRDVRLVSHSMLTNHGIPARPDHQVVRESSVEHDLAQVNAPAEPKPLPPLTLLRAYGQVAAKRPDFEPRYLALLDQLSRTQPDEPTVLAALGRKALFDPDPSAAARARDYLQKAIDKGSTASSTYEDLAEALVRSGHQEEAIVLLEKGLALGPYSRELFHSLARNYNALGRAAEARKTILRYLELFPEDDAARRLLR
jgi:predicted CXXCH cytochrome family protein